ncbi:hypothetical protein [Microbulbifer sp. 2201CG32-9]|uniref:hypothetical protein n=1 Tax=unclassified Microbulbifer TaxID=2619833 RepID=UPI00345B8AC6
MKDSLAFTEFWTWLVEHLNCIVRAGTSDSVIYDAEDYHWRLTQEDPRTLLVQVMRGKRPVAEMFVEPEHVSSVSITQGERGEFNFDLLSDVQGQPQVIYYFVLCHGFEQAEQGAHGEHGRLH